MNLPSLDKARVRSSNRSSIIRDDYVIDEDMKEIGKGKKYHIITYGCQMNVHDSENISAIMEDMSFTRVEDIDKADVIILNTCAIRENAHNKVTGMLGRIKHLKETRNDIIINGNDDNRSLYTWESIIKEMCPYINDRIRMNKLFQSEYENLLLKNKIRRR